MNIKVREEEQVVIFDISGRIMGGPDSETFHNLVKEQIAHGKKQILINLGKVNWINSTGLGILIAGYTSVKDADGQFKLVNISDRIESILMVTKLSGIFESFDSEAEAVASFGS
jgi:anti-sigma B factor antagonist